MYCAACGDTNWQDSRYCPSCGKDLRPEIGQPEPADETAPDVPVGDTGSGPGEQERATPTSAGRRSRRVRPRVAVAAVAVLAVGLGGAVWWHARSGEPDDRSQFTVAMSDHPRLRWQRSLEQWAPELNCPREGAADDLGGAGCSAQVVASTTSWVVVEASHGIGRNLLLGVDRESGNVGWRRSLPAGVVLSCRGDDERVWCISTRDTDYSGTGDAGTQSEPAALLTFAVGSGAPGPTSELGSGQAFVPLDVRAHELFVAVLRSGQGSGVGGASTTALAVGKYDDQARQLWRTTVPGGITGGGLDLMVFSSGVDYLTDAATATGARGVGFRDSDGRLSLVAAGPVAGVFRGKVVSGQIKSGYLIDGHRVSSGMFIPLLSFDSRDDQPLMTLDTTQDGGRFQLRADHPPYAVQHTVDGEPLAFCQGSVIAAGDSNGARLLSIDPAGGTRRWEASLSASPEFVLCAGDQVVAGSSVDGTVTGTALADGRRRWSVTIPKQLAISALDDAGIVFSRLDLGDGPQTFVAVN